MPFGKADVSKVMVAEKCDSGLALLVSKSPSMRRSPELCTFLTSPCECVLGLGEQRGGNVSFLLSLCQKSHVNVHSSDSSVVAGIFLLPQGWHVLVLPVS